MFHFNIPYERTIELLNRKDDWIIYVAKAAKLRNDHFLEIQNALDDAPITGTQAAKKRAYECLMKYLFRKGFSVSKFDQILNEFNQKASTRCDVSEGVMSLKTNSPLPSAKVAILIGNVAYTYLGELTSPTSDCKALGRILKSMNFHVIIIENETTEHLKLVFPIICNIIPKKSFVLLYLAGHGFEYYEQKYFFGVESPTDYTFESTVSQNFLIQVLEEKDPELIVLLLDMCRKQPTKECNPKLYENIPTPEIYTDKCNIITSCSTSPFESAFEIQYDESQSGLVLSGEMRMHDPSNIESDGIGHQITHKLGSERIKGCSEYVRILESHLSKDLDIMSILDLVQKDFANKIPADGEKVQKPQKSDNVSKKFYLSHRTKGDGSIPTLNETVTNLRKQSIKIRYYYKE